MKPIAVIDLGTNTFHMLIVDAHTKPFKELYRKREYVILAEEGIKTIGLNSIKRAKAAVDNFKVVIDKYAPERIKVFGTEALRSASNGHIITDYVSKIIGEMPEVINGEREAELILKGTQLMVDMNEGKFCLMDIGGGSVEIILLSDGNIDFMQSLQIGVTVLFNKFHHHDPIKQEEIKDLKNFLSQELADLQTVLAIDQHKVSLVGASGSYEVLQSMIEGQIKRDSCSHFQLKQFNQLYNDLIATTELERTNLDGLPKPRTKLIIVALILIKHVLEMADFKEIIVSPYALKEGAISELM